MIIAIIFVSSGVNAFAQTVYKVESIDVANIVNNDFVVGPGKVELEVAPGQTKTTVITVSNRMGEAKTFYLDVEDFTGSRNPQETVLLLGNERGPYSLKDYISFETKVFELQHGERAVIPVTVTLPTDAEPGGRYGSVLVSTASKEATSDQKSAIVSRLGVLFFVKTPGEVNEEGELKGFSTINNQKFFGGGPVTFRLLYENNGSVYLNPYGEVSIKNIIGKDVGEVEVDPWFSLPQSLRVREISWDRPLLFGRYTAVASINRGYDNIIDTVTLTFWVIPLKIVLSIFFVIFLFVIGIRFVVTRFEFKRKV